MFSNFLKRLSARVPDVKTYHVVVDAATNIVLTPSSRLSDVALLCECMDVRIMHDVTRPHYRKIFFLEALNPAQYPEWTWGETTRKFTSTPAALLTPEIRRLSRLATLKKILTQEIIRNINGVRSPFVSEIALQETVYMAKRLQAANFRDGGYREAEILQYPYVLQYAELADMSYRDAANEILLKVRLADEALAKSERLRLKYFEAIKRADTPEELKKVRRQFQDEFFVNTTV